MKFLILFPKKKPYKMLSVVVNLLLALGIVFLALIQTKQPYPFWILSVNYAVFTLLCRNNIVYRGPGIFVLNIVMFCRYMILPYAYYLTGELSRFANNYNFMYHGILLMVYEQLGIFLTLAVTGSRQRARGLADRETLNYRLTGPRYANLISVLAVVLLMLILIGNPYFVAGLSLITRGSVDRNIETPTNGFIIMLWEACTAWLYIYWCFRIRTKNPGTGRRGLFSILLLSLGYILLIFIGQTRISRWYAMVSFTAALFIVLKLYPNQHRRIGILMCVPVVTVLVIVSVYKNTSFMGSTNASFRESVKELLDVSVLDPYLAGACNVNNAYGLWHDWNINITCMWKDLLNNMPVVNHWIRDFGASVHQYNMYIGRWWGSVGDNIIPLVGQSMVYFTPVLAPVLSILSVLLLRYFDRKYLCSDTLMVYLYAFAAAWTGCATILNLTIYCSWIYARIIPLFLVTRTVELLSRRKRHRKERADAPIQPNP